jgi:hypothetical protein
MPRSWRSAKPDALVMHPGPMNRGVEIASDIADGPQSVIEEQVEMGVAVRMAIIEALLDEAQERRQGRVMMEPRKGAAVYENARIVDPSRGIDETGSLVVIDGKIAAKPAQKAANQGAPDGATRCATAPA